MKIRKFFDADTMDSGGFAKPVLAAGAFQVVLKTSEYRGDHATDVTIAVNVDANTTIAELIELVFKTGLTLPHGMRVASKAEDWIEVRCACS